ncbi:Tol-Pal system beta propeller repeat protein TolB [Phreatobacter stygius]|nr:Tol-Pal system beta propeller repeat protein TolB [Phreatobacter stygius]
MTLLLNRRNLLSAGAALGASGLVSPYARAQQSQPPVIDIRRGQVQPFPIAVPNFGGEGDIGRNISGVIENNLRRSGFFRIIDRQAYANVQVDPDQAPNFQRFQATGAAGLVTGRAGRGADGRSRVEFRLWDVAQGSQLHGQQFATQEANWRRIAHIISDQIFERVTGEKGHFDTRVVFVDETGPKDRRQKRLAIMDQDGANVRYLTRGGDLVLTPRFSPSSQDITYMAYNSGEPRVFLLNIESGQREQVGNFPGMSFSPRFSPDGQRIVLSLQQGAGSSIYSMDLRSKNAVRLTDGSAIDTGPSFSPDGRQIVFESDRGGTQQLYVMSSGGGAANRISFGEGRYSTPVWSPRGDLIAFTRQGGGQFSIGVMKPDGSGERILTSGYHNEGPTFAPNGLFVMFFRDQGAGPQLFQSDIFARAENRVPTPSFGSDPAWGPTLS